MSAALVTIKDCSRHDRRYQILRQICQIEMGGALPAQCITAIDIRGEWITVTTSGSQLAQIIQIELLRTFDLTEVHVIEALTPTELQQDAT